MKLVLENGAEFDEQVWGEDDEYYRQGSDVKRVLLRWAKDISNLAVDLTVPDDKESTERVSPCIDGELGDVAHFLENLAVEMQEEPVCKTCTYCTNAHCDLLADKFKIGSPDLKIEFGVHLCNPDTQVCSSYEPKAGPVA